MAFFLKTVGSLSLVAVASLAAPTVASAQTGAGSNVIGELDAVGSVRIAHRDAPAQQVNVSNTRTAFFTGDGLATGAGAHAVLGLENESKFMFAADTGGAMGVVDQRVLGNVDFGTVCFAIPLSSVEMALTGGPYLFSATGAASGIITLVEGRIEIHVRDGELTVRDAGSVTEPRSFEATLSAGESLGLSIADVGSTVPIRAVADPCTPLGFGWLGPDVGVPATIAGTTGVLGGGGAAAGAVAIVTGVAAAGAALQDDRRPDPVSP